MPKVRLASTTHTHIEHTNRRLSTLALGIDGGEELRSRNFADGIATYRLDTDQTGRPVT
jgi:hypothetical protein